MRFLVGIIIFAFGIGGNLLINWFSSLAGWVKGFLTWRPGKNKIGERAKFYSFKKDGKNDK